MSTAEKMHYISRLINLHKYSIREGREMPYNTKSLPTCYLYIILITASRMAKLD